jgi:hypothetical protein
MTGIEREGETENPDELRSAAVEALLSAAHQSDPREFDRLTRHALGLIQRARAIRHSLRPVRPRGAPVLREDDGMAKREEFRMPGKLRAKFIDTLCRLCSWRAR